MNPDPKNQAWRLLLDQGGGRIRPGFADRVLRAARAGVESMPSLLAQIVWGGATVAACAVMAVVVHTRSTQSEDDVALAGWQQIAYAGTDLGQAQ